MHQLWFHFYCSLLLTEITTILLPKLKHNLQTVVPAEIYLKSSLIAHDSDIKTLDPLSPKYSDQCHISLCSIDAFFTRQVIRIKIMITQNEFFIDPSTTSPNLCYNNYYYIIKQCISDRILEN